MSHKVFNKSQAKGDFSKSLGAHERNLSLPRIAPTWPVDEVNPKYVFSNTPPLATEWVGPRKTGTISPREISIKNARFESSVTIPYRLIETDQTGNVRRFMSMLSGRMAALKARKIFELIRDGHTAAVKAYDGQNFFGTHSNNGHAVNNNPAVGQIPSLGGHTAPTRPTIEKTVEVIMDSVAYMKSFKDDQGDPSNELANEFQFVVPPNLFPAFSTALSANHLAGGQTNVLQGDGELLARVNADGESFRIRVRQEARFPNTTVQFYLFRTDWIADPPMIITQERDVMMRFKDEDSDFFFDNDAIEVGADWTGGFGPGEFAHALRGTLSS